MKIPVYNISTVQPVAPQRPMLTGMPDPGTGGAAALGRLSDTLMKEAVAEREKVEATELKTAKLEAMEGIAQVLSGKAQPDGSLLPGLEQASGEQARGLEGQYRAQHDKIIGQAAARLKGFPAAAQLFDQWGKEQFIHHSASLNKREAVERDKSLLAVNDALLKNSFDGMLRAYIAGDEVDIFDPNGEMERAVRDSGKVQGWTKEQTDRKLGEVRSSLLAKMIDHSLDQGDLTSAKGVYADFKEYIGSHDQEVVNKLGHRVAQEESFARVDKFVADLASTAPKRLSEEFKLDEARNAIRNSPDLDRKERHDAEVKLEEFDRERRQRLTQKEHAASNSIIKMQQQGKGYAELRREVAKLDDISPHAIDGMNNWLDHKFRIHEKEAEARAEEKMRKNLAFLVRYQDFTRAYMEGGVTLQPKQVAGMISEFGQFTDDAVRFVEKVNNGPAAKVEHGELVNQIRILSGNDAYKDLLPAVDKQTVEDKAKLALLQIHVQDLMDTSKAVSPPGKGMSMNQALLQAIRKVETDGNKYFFATEDPQYLLGSEFASKYGKNPAKWPKKTQDEFIEWQFRKRNPKGTLSKETRDKYRLALTEGAN